MAAGTGKGEGILSVGGGGGAAGRRAAARGLHVVTVWHSASRRRQARPRASLRLVHQALAAEAVEPRAT